MDLMKLQNLLNECIMIEQGNYLGGNFSVDLAEVQAELDQAKQLLIPRVMRCFSIDEMKKCADFWNKKPIEQKYFLEFLQTITK